MKGMYCLSVLKKQAGAQFLMMNQDLGLHPPLQCSDGSEVYFDITLMYKSG